MFCNVSGAQNLSGWSKFQPGHWALSLQKLPLVRLNFCAWVFSAIDTDAYDGGRPKGLPYPNQGDSWGTCRAGAEGELPRRGKRN